MSSRKDKRAQKKIVNIPQSFNLKPIYPLTDNQKIAFDAYDDNKNLMLHGIAGTGKSFISLYLALDELLNLNTEHKKIVIIRSVVPTRDMGFLPGNAKEKAMAYESPYYAIFTELFGRSDAYDYMKNKNQVQFMTTSFIRGITLNDCIVIVDEIANCTLHELDSVITRIGKNCRIIFCGDFRQSDFIKQSDKKGLLDFLRIIQKMKSFEFIDFDENDICRSSLVKDYIIQKDRLKIATQAI